MTRETKTIILDAAEALFAEQGFAATSLRAITSRAGVNLASVNYHFGSKEALVDLVFRRRIIPMNRERISRLEGLESHTGGSEPSLEALIAAFIAPPLEMARDTGSGGAVFVRLLGRSYTEPSETMQTAMRAMYEPVIDRFKQAFARALPGVPPEELYWRMHFMVGVLAYMMAGTDMMRLIASSRVSDPPEIGDLVRRMTDFVAAGMRSGQGYTLSGSDGGIVEA
ncbi:MAG: TetR/AcrR family transcriptional regulator [Pseudomonadota bacterium]|nr:TetR/AcrR family transcriptional regulator [Pseudomonadota bacterium]